MEYKYVCEQEGSRVRKVWNTSMYVNKRGGRGEKGVEYKYVCEQGGGGEGGNTSMYVNKTGGGEGVEYKYVCEQGGVG